MLILVTYDVRTVDRAGQARLRNVAKVCQNYGQRVQNSVFECVVDQVQYLSLKTQLASIIETSSDSLRFYRLGANWARKVEHIGAKEVLSVKDPIIL